MTDEPQFLTQVLLDNQHAVTLCRQLFRVSQIADDLHDGDQAVSTDTLKAMLWEVLVELPSNPFYRDHFSALQPLIRLSLMDWLDSTDLEAGSAHDQTLAFVLRDSLTGLVSQCAYLIGGYAWMIQVSPAIRRYFHDETLADYQASLEAPLAQPETPSTESATSPKETEL